MANPAFEELVESFTFLEDWEDRYRHIIELGKAMPALSAEQKIAGYKVEGCASQVWIVPTITGNGAAAHFDFDGDSDAIIVKGLIAVLKCLIAGRSMAEITELDVMGELARLDLSDHLSSQRSNGLRAMVAHIRGWAKAAVQNSRDRR